MNGHDKEALRQQMLLRSLLGDSDDGARPGVVAGWLRDGARTGRGLAAYRANAGALAEQALAAVYPTLQQLLGDDSFAGLARDFWRRHPPAAGDIALWGEGLAAFVADAESLAEEPYLADVARLEWAVHGAERAADAAPSQGLDLLALHDPATLWMQLAPAAALIVSPHPVVSIWQAHRSTAADRFDAVRAAFAAGHGETAWIVREGFVARVLALNEPDARFTAALLQGRALAQALDAAGADFSFETWLVTALQQQWLAAVLGRPPSRTSP